MDNNNFHVYFISDNFYIKIGHTNNIEKRINSLQTANARTLRVLTNVSFNTKKEANNFEVFCHNNFINQHVSGEWFNLNPNTLEKELSLLMKEFNPSKKIRSTLNPINCIRFVTNHQFLVINGTFINDINLSINAKFLIMFLLRNQYEFYDSFDLNFISKNTGIKKEQIILLTEELIEKGYMQKEEVRCDYYVDYIFTLFDSVEGDL